MVLVLFYFLGHLKFSKFLEGKVFSRLSWVLNGAAESACWDLTSVSYPIHWIRIQTFCPKTITYCMFSLTPTRDIQAPAQHWTIQTWNLFIFSFFGYNFCLNESTWIRIQSGFETQDPTNMWFGRENENSPNYIQMYASIASLWLHSFYVVEGWRNFTCQLLGG
jgi:hypothetical protein